MKFLARLLKKVSSINTFLSDYLALIGGLIILLLMLAVVGGAISRYFFGRAVASVTELSAYSLLFITFLGGPFLARTNGHISVDLLPTILRERSKKVVTIVTNLFSFLTSIVLAWHGFESTYKSFASHEVVANILRTPKYLLLLVIAIGFLLMAISFLINAIKPMKSSGNEQ